jgi:peptidyl-Asp metalloendopeptidase
MNMKIFIITVLISFLILVPLVCAEPVNPPEELFRDVAVSADAGAAGQVIDHQVVRSRRVGVDFELLYSSKNPQGVDRVKLSLFDDIGLVASKKRLEKRARGNYTWFGYFPEDRLSSVVIVVEDGIMAGNIQFRGKVFQIRSAGNNSYFIHEIDQSRFPAELPPKRVFPAPKSRSDIPSVLAADDGSTIDVMVVYTPAALSAAGGLSAMNALIQLGVDETNQSYENSLITQRINLVYKAQVTYTESGDFGTDLDNLTNGDIANVHTWRDAYGADLVSMWIEGTQYCGIAWLMTTVDTSFESLGFSVIARSCATGYYSFGHEMGHNMGANHDWYVDDSSLPYTYAHGYINLAGLWRTIMAYNNECSDAGYNCTRIQYWSNPDVLYSGSATGVEGGSTPADNSRTLNNTAYTVANFRQSVCSISPVKNDQTETLYETIQSAYNDALTNQTLLLRATDFTENLAFGSSINITLAGGYDCSFTANSGVSTIIGKMTIRRGRVKADKLIIR